MTRALVYGLLSSLLVGAIGVGIQSLRLANCQRNAALVEKAWAEAYGEAIGKVLIEERQHNRASEAAADGMRAQVDGVLPGMQDATVAAAERVRTVIREVQVPAGCPTTLPPAVVTEGQAAVERARRAGQ